MDQRGVVVGDGVLALVSELGDPETVDVAGVEAVLVSAGGVPGIVPVAVVVEVVVSPGVDAVVGDVEVVVVTEPGVALAPELLYPVLAPLLHPARPAVARARTAT